MGATTGIAWTNHTFNPWWGCARVSDGCLHCYAETSSKRWGHDLWGKTAARRQFGDKHWDEPLKWDAAAQAAGVPALVFCASMADVFEDHDEVVEARERLWELISRTPWLRWQLLTKRPENVRHMVPWWWLGGYKVASDWPLNVWIGTTIEHQKAADERLPILAELPAPVRFVSCEPLLGPVDLTPFLARSVDWVIVGGESGAGCRPMHPTWARSLVIQSEAAGVPVFFKQMGGNVYLDGVAGGDLLAGVRTKQLPDLGVPV